MGRLNGWIEALKDQRDAFVDEMRADPLRIFDFDVDLSDSFAGWDAHVAVEQKTGSKWSRRGRLRENARFSRV